MGTGVEYLNARRVCWVRALRSGRTARRQESRAAKVKNRKPLGMMQLTAAQMRTLSSLAAGDDVRRGVSWTTLRVLQNLGLCVLGPGRAVRLTARGLRATPGPRSLPAPDAGPSMSACG